MSGGAGFTKLTHYEVLGVKTDCTQEQLKNAFLDLSKKYHPDINSSDTKLHAKFVKINEAYSVLRAADSRRAYDSQLRYGPSSFSAQSAQSYRRANPYPFHDRYHEGDHWARQRFYYDPTIDPRQTRGKQQYTDDRYYGFRGIPRQPNYAIVAACLLFVIVGSATQFFAILYGSSTLNRRLLTSQSDARSIVYGQTRKTAEENGNDKQLEILARRLGHGTDTD